MPNQNQIAEYSPTQAGLAELSKELSGVVYDCSKAEGMKAAKAARSKVVTLRTTLESVRKEIKEPALRRCQAIDSEARRITGEIQKLEDPIVAQIQKEEKRKAELKAEKERKKQAKLLKWRNRIEATRRRPLDFIHSTLDEIRAAIEKAEAVSVDDFPDELVDEAKAALSSAILKLKEMILIAERDIEEAQRVKKLEEENAKLKAAAPKQTEVTGATLEKLDKEFYDVTGAYLVKTGIPSIPVVAPMADPWSYEPEPEPVGRTISIPAGADVREMDPFYELLDCARAGCTMLEQSPFTRNLEATKKLRAAIQRVDAL